MATPISSSTACPPIMADWLAHLAGEKRLAVKSLHAYRRDCLQFLHFLVAHHGASPSAELLARVQPSDIRAFLIQRRSANISGTSLARMMSSLRSFYRFAAQQGHQGWEAVRVCHSPKRRRRLPRAASMAAMESLLAIARQHHGAAWLNARDLALLTLLYGAGLRLGEALALQGGAIATGDVLRVRGKGGKERQVPILPVIRHLVGIYRRLCPFPLAPEGALFLSQKGRPLSARQVQARLTTLRREAGLSEQLTPHALRHAFASHLLRQSGNLRLIQTLLGHASLTTTQIYADLEDADMRHSHAQFHPRAQL